MYQRNHFRAFSIHWGSSGIMLSLPELCSDDQESAWVNRGSNGVIRERPEKHRHEPYLHLGSALIVRSASWVVSLQFP
jgi:hypothetical protein